MNEKTVNAVLQVLEGRALTVDRTPNPAQFHLGFRSMRLDGSDDAVSRELWARKMADKHARLAVEVFLPAAIDEDGNWRSCEVEIPLQACCRCGWKWDGQLVRSAWREGDICMGCYTKEVEYP
jgi:hypothetical protein